MASVKENQEKSLSLDDRVFWEGYGLDRQMSGVYVHAASLAAQLVPLGCTPTIIGSFATRDLFPEVNLIELQPLGVLDRLFQLKPLHPLRTIEVLRRHLKRAGENRPVVLHGLSNINLPALNPDPRRVRMVITIHDLIPMLAPDGVSTAYRLQFASLLPRVVAVADRIICVSEWTRQTLIDRFPGVAGKIQVIRNAFFPKQVVPVETSTRESRDYVTAISVCRHEPYKRLPELLQVIRAGRGTVRLTLVTDTEGAEWARGAGADLISQSRLQVRERVSTAVLAKLYADHDVYVHPSRLEGFCLPAAEAMAAGLPVVYQSGSGIDEVVGKEAGFPMPPDASEASWIDACKAANALRVHPEFVSRLNAQLASIGSWKDSAAKLKKLYTDLL